MKTFYKWPKQMRPSAVDLVNSGFFYKGSGDYVECFFVEFVYMTGKLRTMLQLNITNGLLLVDFFL